MYNLIITAYSPPQASNTKNNSPAAKFTCPGHLIILGIKLITKKNYLLYYI